VLVLAALAAVGTEAMRRMILGKFPEEPGARDAAV